jgi:ABC-2 type transport system permease protein
MRIFGLNRRIIRVLLGCQYAHMLEYRAEIALWALSGVLPFIMLSVWSGSDARSGLGLDGVALDRYFLSAFLVRQFSVVWVVYAFEEDALQGRLSPYLLQPLHPLWRYVAAHLGEQLTRLPFAALIAAVFFAVQPQAFWLPSLGGFLLAWLAIWPSASGVRRPVPWSGSSSFPFCFFRGCWHRSQLSRRRCGL